MVFEPGGGTLDRREQGFHLQYVYVVGADAYPAIAFRTWSDVGSHEAKVCYDPRNPGDHLLVDGDVACGVGAMFREAG